MMKDKYIFKDVTLLVTHYNRSESLRHLLETFGYLGCSFEDIVVSDDGSKPFHQEKLVELKEEFGFRLITTPVNKGLGNNLNKGQDAVETPYTLYVQEDFEPQEAFPSRFEQALGYMNQCSELDIVRFYSYIDYPYLKPFENGFSEMYIKPFAYRYKKIYYYSDHPHLRRSTFFEKFGRYVEGQKGDKTEYQMCISFIRNKGKGLFYNDYKSLFTQVNTSSEPSTMSRSSLTLSKNPVISMIRNVYRQVKYNYDLHF